MRWRGPLCTLDQHSELDFHSASSMKQQSTDRHLPHSDTLSWFQANQSLLFLLNAVCLVEKKQIPNLKSLVWPDLVSNPPLNALEASKLTITPPILLTKMEDRVLPPIYKVFSYKTNLVELWWCSCYRSFNTFYKYLRPCWETWKSLKRFDTQYYCVMM